MTSLTPCSASQRVSPSTSLGRREMKEPRKDGMAQKEQRRSQPEASLTDATGLLSRRRRSGARGPEAGATPSGRSAGASVELLDGRRLRVAGQRHLGVLAGRRADREQLAPVTRGVGGVDAAVEDGLQAVGDVGVVVEAEHAVGLGKRLGELLAVALGHAADGDDGLGLAVILEIVGFQQGVYGVLFGGFDEAAGVDDGYVRIGGVLDELPAIRRQAACELLRVHLVTGAAKSDKGDGTAFGHGLKTTLSKRRPPPQVPVNQDPRSAAQHPGDPESRIQRHISPPVRLPGGGRPWCM